MTIFYTRYLKKTCMEINPDWKYDIERAWNYEQINIELGLYFIIKMN